VLAALCAADWVKDHRARFALIGACARKRIYWTMVCVTRAEGHIRDDERVRTERRRRDRSKPRATGDRCRGRICLYSRQKTTPTRSVALFARERCVAWVGGSRVASAWACHDAMNIESATDLGGARIDIPSSRQSNARGALVDAPNRRRCDKRAQDDRRDDRDLERDSWMMGPKVDVADSGVREADLQEVPLGLQMGHALELDPELAALRGRELLDLADPALERRYYPPVLAGAALRI
jgi:hypothetical protein